MGWQKRHVRPSSCCAPGLPHQPPSARRLTTVNPATYTGTGGSDVAILHLAGASPAVVFNRKRRTKRVQ
ncbi:hypothetical protein ACCAA_1120024 [Candidatus Accumulibacter aalborgensis]|uniref:Uncharacterized protein n=1 Tax=Candidatus Accumulibacter aalborgensis TaxID=1860102 RepID=A0A1A8XF26_9PROT|nr:hypothetical protein ACCAA_1120024 [Candidatus Accumulibacter aalborgensis]